jgi:elongation factor Ts
MSLKRFTTMDIADNNELAIDYIHGEGRIGVIVKLKVDNPALKHNQMVKEKCFDLALHIAAYAPLFLSKENVPEDYIKEQEEIFLKQAKNLGKPEKVLNGIVKGKLNKHFSEICVMEQGFVKEDKKKVSQVLKELSQEVGGQVEISDYLYFKVGVE